MKKLIILLAVLPFLSCETPSNCDPYYYSEEFKGFVMKPIGSRWIYVDTLHQVSDTVSLLEQSLSFNDICKVNVQPHEVLKQGFKSSFFYGDTIIPVYSSAYISSTYDASPIGVFHNGIKKVLDSVEINGMLFRDVRVFSGINIDTNERFYWAKEVGLIRKICYRRSLPSDTTLYTLDIQQYKLNK